MEPYYVYIQGVHLQLGLRRQFPNLDISSSLYPLNLHTPDLNIPAFKVRYIAGHVLAGMPGGVWSFYLGYQKMNLNILQVDINWAYFPKIKQLQNLTILGTFKEMQFIEKIKVIYVHCHFSFALQVDVLVFFCCCWGIEQLLPVSFFNGSILQGTLLRGL